MTATFRWLPRAEKKARRRIKELEERDRTIAELERIVKEQGGKLELLALQLKPVATVKVREGYIDEEGRVVLKTEKTKTQRKKKPTLTMKCF